jgi:basic membrane lipoprotein Med (substrate-binding protein (PBP1-ABC) superfamily)
MLINNRKCQVKQIKKNTKATKFSFFLLSCFFCCTTFLFLTCQKNGTLSTSTAFTQTDTFKVALVLPSAIDDASWSQAAYEGLMSVAEKLNIQVTIKASVDNKIKQIEVFRAITKEDYDFIIGHGEQFAAVMEEMARAYPHINFALFSYYAGNNQNLGGISFRYEELSYIVGIVAALHTTTGKIGFIGGVPFAHMKDIVHFFEKGVQFINPHYSVDIQWLNSWKDIELGKKLTLEMVNKKIDTLLVLANEANLPIHNLARTQNIKTIGWVKDFYIEVPQAVITSGVQDLSRLFLESILLVQKGKWEGKLYKFGFKEGAHFLAPFRDSLSPEKQTLINSIIDKIIMGEVKLF